VADVVGDGDGPFVGVVIVITELGSLFQQSLTDFISGGGGFLVLEVGLQGMTELFRLYELFVETVYSIADNESPTVIAPAVGPPSVE
jgi:hypothetical protein